MNAKNNTFLITSTILDINYLFEFLLLIAFNITKMGSTRNKSFFIQFNDISLLLIKLNIMRYYIPMSWKYYQ